MFDPQRAFATGYVAVSGNDSTDLPRPLKGLNISAAGTVKITTVGTANTPSVTVTIYCPVGDVGTAPIQRLWATGGTATVAAGII